MVTLSGGDLRMMQQAQSLYFRLCVPVPKAIISLSADCELLSVAVIGKRRPGDNEDLP
jgi:hypothetical protein